MNHRLKTHPEPFGATWEGRKPYELRKNDRGFQVGDQLELIEWSPTTEAYSGRAVLVRVTYMTKGGEWGLPSDLCILGFDPEDRTQLWETSV